MKKFFLYSSLLSGVISFVVWIGTVPVATESQTLRLMMSFIQTKIVNLKPLEMALREHYYIEGYLPSSLSELRIAKIEGVEYQEDGSIKHQTPYLRDTLTVSFEPQWNDSEALINFKCYLDGEFDNKPIIMGCEWKNSNITQ